MNYLPNNAEEISLLKFIAKFQYLSVNDAKYFFSTSKYYRKRITRLVKENYLRRESLVLTLDFFGTKYIKQQNAEYYPIHRNPKYMPRLLYISNLGAYYNNCDILKFIPALAIKDKEVYTVKSRKYVGLFEINGIDYLTYHITNEHDNKYIKSVIYDIQKEQCYDNIIILYDAGVKLNKNDFTFGKNQVLLIEDTEENRKILPYINCIKWNEVIKSKYWTKLEISEYKFCDYSDGKNRFVSCLSYFYDTEKINRLKQFLEVNKNRSVDVICPEFLKEDIRKNLPEANIHIIEIEKYTDLKRNVYG